MVSILVEITKVTGSSTSISPIVHLEPSNEPLSTLTIVTSVNPLGMTSSTYASSALEGPLFLTVMVHVIVSPLRAFSTLASLTTLKSATGLILIVALSSLLDKFQSLSTQETLAELTTLFPTLIAVVTIVNFAELPLVIFLIVQVLVALSYVPFVAVALTKETSEGKTSFKVMLSALDAFFAFLTVIVQVTVSPI